MRALIVGIDANVTQEQATEMRRQMEALLPGLTVVIISHCTQLATIDYYGRRV